MSIYIESDDDATESEVAAAREIEDLFSLGRGYHNFQRSCEIFLSSLAVRCLRDEEKKLLAAIATGQSLREELRGRLDYLAQIGLIKRSPDRINGKILEETYKQLSKDLA